jgi:hypothetical protein
MAMRWYRQNVQHYFDSIIFHLVLILIVDHFLSSLEILGPITVFLVNTLR